MTSLLNLHLPVMRLQNPDLSKSQRAQFDGSNSPLDPAVSTVFQASKISQHSEASTFIISDCQLKLPRCHPSVPALTCSGHSERFKF